MKHTPGPWAVRSKEPGYLVQSTHGDLVAMPNLALESAQANAQLVAASPELLAALREIVSQIDQGDPGAVFGRDACIARARAAIERATA